MKSFIFIAVLMAVWAGTADPVQAEVGFPSRAMRFIVPVTPGSGADTNTRAFADRFGIISGQPTVVENRPGGDMLIAMQSLLNAPADGYSALLISNSSMVINPLLIKDLPYKAADVIPILALSRVSAAIIVGPQSRFKSLADLLAAAREKPGTVTMGTYGNTYKLGVLDLANRAGVQFNLIPYKGASQALSDAVGGNVDAVMMDAGATAPLAVSGKVRALVVTADKRTTGMPDIPTAQESGIAGYTRYVYIGYGVHARTPPDVVDKLEALMQKTMASPEVRAAIQRQGAEVLGDGRQGFAAIISADAVSMRELIRVAGPEALNVKQ